MNQPHPELEIHKHVVDSLFEVFENMCEGAISVDRESRIVWINDKYRSLLGIGADDDVLGMEIETVIQESQMRQVVETGQPIPLDIMQFQKNYFVVSRLPLHDQNGRVIGAVGFVLYDNLDYLKPLISKFEKLQDRLSSVELELLQNRRTRYALSQIVGNSPPMVDLRRQARRVAKSSSPVMLQGETGTGKELLAHSIHALSDRAHGPFVAINMGAVPENLLESEFFGVAPGAFTDAAKKGRPGKFEVASGGTLFLDEIADMPLHMQGKLLRVLEEKVVEPVGSNDFRRVDVRIISATSQDIDVRVAQGKFRSDLYYRLNVLQIRSPPLRDRILDLRQLCEVLLDQIALNSTSTVKELGLDAFVMLQSHSWPGNVRELRNVLERACTDTEGEVLTVEVIRRSLPDTFREQLEIARHPLPASSLSERIACVEREAIEEALRLSSGKKAAAARLLGIARSTLYDKIREYNLS